MKKDVFAILAKLSSTDRNGSNEFNDKCGELIRTIDEKIIPILYRSHYPSKSKLKSSLKKITDDALFMCGFPEMIGHTVVGILYDEKDHLEIHKILKNDIGTDIPLRTGTPNILVYGKKLSVRATNHHGSEQSLDNKEFGSLLELPKSNIEIKDVVSYMTFTAPHRYEDIVFIFFPRSTYASEEIVSLSAHCSIMLALDPSAIETLEHLSPKVVTPEVRSYIDVFLSYVTVYKTKKHKNLRSDIVPVHIGNISKRLGQANAPRHNFMFADRLSSELLLFRQDLASRQKERSDLLESFNKDLIFMEQQSDVTATETCKSLLKELKEDINNLKELESGFISAQDEILDIARALEDMMSQQAPRALSSGAIPHSGNIPQSTLWRNIALRSLKIGDKITTNEYASRLAKRYPIDGSIVNLYLDEANGRPLSDEALSYIRYAKQDSPEILRDRLHFSRALGLRYEEKVNIASRLKDHKDADELYFYARSLPIDKRERPLLKAILAGSSKATRHALEIYLTEEKKLEFLKTASRMGDAESSWQLYSFCKAQEELQVSVALGYPPAVNEYAKVLYNQVINLVNSKYYFDADSGSFLVISQDFDFKLKDIAIVKNILSAYKWMARDEHQIADAENEERLGILCCLSGDSIRAYSILDKISNQGGPNTAMGCFALAVMKRYGYGCSKSRGYMEFIDQAIGIANKKIKAEYERIKAKWQESDEEREKRRELQEKEYKKTYREETKERSSSSGPCFITSATCRAEGRPDDCPELTAFRRYRDEILSKTPEGAELIKTYYRIAPTIVERIDSDEQRDTIYDDLFTRYIEPCYALLLNNDCEAAKALYIDMVTELAKRYDIAI